MAFVGIMGQKSTEFTAAIAICGLGVVATAWSLITGSIVHWVPTMIIAVITLAVSKVLR